jgi:hypothetical protein
MTHHPDQTYSLADLHAHCLATGDLAEAQRLELYMSLQHESRRIAEDPATHVELAPSSVVLPATA